MFETNGDGKARATLTLKIRDLEYLDAGEKDEPVQTAGDEMFTDEEETPVAES